MSEATPPPNKPPLIVLFDGSCGMCNATVNFILARDPEKRFRFAALQSPLAHDLMVQHGLDSEQIDTVVLIEGDQAFTQSNAVLRIAMELPEPWPLMGVLVFIPATLRDQAYDFIARNRKQWFKSTAYCTVPTDEQREQFLA